MKPSLLPIVFVGLFACVGCGQKGLDVHAVEGVVTLDGVPLAEATISLYPTDPSGNLGSANTDAQGQYRISTHGGAAERGTTLGTYKVAFNKVVPDGNVPTLEESNAPDFNPNKFPGLVKTKDLIPKKYRSVETSGFEVIVQKGKNVRNFDLSSQ